MLLKYAYIIYKKPLRQIILINISIHLAQNAIQQQIKELPGQAGLAEIKLLILSKRRNYFDQLKPAFDEFFMGGNLFHQDLRLIDQKHTYNLSHITSGLKKPFKNGVKVASPRGIIYF